MQKISIPIIFILAFVANACWEKHEPSPNDKISNMAVSARKVNDEVLLTIIAYTFKNHSGPEPTSFDTAEVWISEGASGFSNMKLAYTTSQESIKLENLQPDKNYYVSVKGIKKGEKTDFARQIMFTTSSLKPKDTILELSNSLFMSSSSISPYMAYIDTNTGEIVLQNWEDKSKKVIFKNSTSKSYLVKGFYAQGSRLYLQTTKNNDRAFDYYDMATQKFVELEIPAGARVWNYAFSPDGTQLAYTDYDKQGLYIYNIATKVNKQFSNDGFYYFDWSNDGKSIIQMRNKVNAGGDIKEIVKLSLNNDGQPTARQLFEWTDSMQWVSISPKDEYLLFGSSVANNPDLWVYDMTTKKTWQISDAVNFGWLSDKEFFVNANKSTNETSWKTYRYTLP